MSKIKYIKPSYSWFPIENKDSDNLTMEDLLARLEGLQGNVQNYNVTRDKFNNERRHRENIKPDPTLMHEYSYNELLPEIGKLVRNLKEKFASQPMPEYPGKKLPPRSDFTQKARDLQNQYLGKKAPYSTKQQIIRDRPKAGFNEEQFRGLSDILNRHGDKDSSIILKQLSRNFRDSYDPRYENMKNKLEHKTQKNIPDYFSVNDINRELSKNSEIGDFSLLKLLENLGEGKNSMRKSHIGALENMGKQESAFSKEKLNQDAREYAQEIYEPIMNLEKLQRNLVTAIEKGNPQGEQIARQHIQKVLSDAGINVNAPVDKWSESIKAPNIKEYGESKENGILSGRIEPLPKEVIASQRALMRLNPKLEGQGSIINFDPNNPIYSADADDDRNYRKNLERELIKGVDLPTKIYNETEDSSSQNMKGLNRQLKQALKKEMTKLSNRFLRLGQHGSAQHIIKAEEIAKEFANKNLENRVGTLKEDINKRIPYAVQDDQIKMEKLKNAGTSREKNFSNILSDIEDFNKTGINKWKNNQYKKDQKYNEFLNSIQAPSVPVNSQPIGNVSLNPQLEANYAKNLAKMYALQPYEHVARDLNISLPEVKNKVIHFDELFQENDPYLKLISNTMSKYGDKNKIYKKDEMSADQQIMDQAQKESAIRKARREKQDAENKSLWEKQIQDAKKDPISELTLDQLNERKRLIGLNNAEMNKYYNNLHKFKEPKISNNQANFNRNFDLLTQHFEKSTGNRFGLDPHYTYGSGQNLDLKDSAFNPNNLSGNRYYQDNTRTLKYIDDFINNYINPHPNYNENSMMNKSAVRRIQKYEQDLAKQKPSFANPQGGNPQGF